MTKYINIFTLLIVFITVSCEKSEIEPDASNDEDTEVVGTPLGPAVTTVEVDFTSCRVNFIGSFDLDQFEGGVDFGGIIISPYNLAERMLVTENQGEAGIWEISGMVTYSTIVGDHTGKISVLTDANIYRIYSGVTFYYRAYIRLENGEYLYGDIETFRRPATEGNGEAGGFLFYDKGSYSDGWRYLELAPTHIVELTEDFKHEIGLIQWSESSGEIISGTYTGDGYLDTQEILNNCSDCTAAILCDDYSYGGFDDWFLPSATELGLLRANNILTNSDIACDYYIKKQYWSSSQVNDRLVSAPAIIGSGFETYIGKTASLPVRPIRRY